MAFWLGVLRRYESSAIKKKSRGTMSALGRPPMIAAGGRAVGQDAAKTGERTWVVYCEKQCLEQG